MDLKDIIELIVYNSPKSAENVRIILESLSNVMNGTKADLKESLIKAQENDEFDRARKIIGSQEQLAEYASGIDGLLEFLKDAHPGKDKCETLRAIRKKIADANGIEFEPHECTHVGPCLGTCPICDSELAYLEKELDAKKERGEEILIDGIGEDEIEKSGCNIDFNSDYLDLGGIPTMGGYNDGMEDIEAGVQDDIPFFATGED